MAFALRRLATASAGSVCIFGQRNVRCEGKDGLPFGGSFPTWLTFDNATPLTGGFTIGGVSGFASGFACKKIGKAVGIFVGSLYILFQTAAHYDYITINWKRVEKDLAALAGVNKDGKIDEKKFGIYYSKAMLMLSNDGDSGDAARNSAAGSFGVGFLAGLRKG